MNPEFQSHFALGRHLLEAKSYARAATELELALQIEPDNPRARLLLARCLGGLQKTAQARREVQTVLQNRPDDVDALYLLSLWTPDTRAARRAIERALELRPNAAFLHAQLASVHLRSASPISGGWRFLVTNGNSARFQAEIAARRALELDPRDAMAHRLLASALMARNRVEEAREHVMQAMELHPENPRSHVLLSLLHNRQNDVQSEEAALREALRLDPVNRGFQRHLKVHLASERVTGFLGQPAAQFGMEEHPRGFAFGIYQRIFGKLAPRWRLPALVAACAATLSAVVTFPSQMGPGFWQTAVVLGLLAWMCFLLFHFNYAARPYLARVPRQFLPTELKPWGKPEAPSEAPEASSPTP